MAQNLPEEKIKAVVEKTLKHPQVFGVQLAISQHGSTFEYGLGNLQNQKPYFIASTSKLYITAIILRLQEEKKLNIEDKISKYLDEELINGLHNLDGKDYSKDVTIKHLMSQTSGLPDYFGEKLDGGSLQEQISQGLDSSWTFEEAIARSKKMKPHFAPGKKGKAFYSDTNFQLLGKIIESITGLPLHLVMKKYIFNPLNLKHTHLFTSPKSKWPSDLYNKENALHIPLAMSSFKADGGIVSNASESLIFIKAFFDGTFFSTDLLKDMYVWNSVMFPLTYVVGLMRFKLPRIFSPFKPSPEFIGHSGLSGAFAFYSPKKQVFIAGTVNQIHHPGLSYRMMLKILLNLPD